MKASTYFALLIIIGFILAVIVGGSKKIEADAKICQLNGGVQVKTYDGFVCVGKQQT